MSDPEVVWLGIKIIYAIGGFLGGVVALSFGKGLTVIEGFIAVIASIATAAGLTPLCVWLIDKFVFDGPMPVEARFTIAFLLGLTAMHIIPGILKVAEIFKRRPLLFFGKHRKEDE